VGGKEQAYKGMACEDNIKMDNEETGFVNGRWMELARVHVQCLSWYHQR
jgi:hypothetical protein